MNVCVDSVIAATAAVVRRPDLLPKEFVLSTDTRSLQPGQTYLALRGEQFDGHDYVALALGKGACGVIVERPESVPDGVAALVVPDTKRAYMQIAREARKRWHGRAVAITGSAGKTTTKAFLQQLLCAIYGDRRVYASPGNENNELGVSKLLFALQPQHEFAVIEMGARHPGEIAELVEISLPDVGVLTNIGEAHLEIFGSRETLAATKWGLFSHGAQAVLNADDAESRARAKTLDAPPRWFGTGEGPERGTWLNGDSLVITDEGEPRSYGVQVPFPGAHNRANLAAAIAGARALGADGETLAEAAATLRLPAGRYERMMLRNGVVLIYDAYNANLSGMIATLDAFAHENAAHRIAVLSSMAELGAEALSMHRRVGEHAARANLDTLLVGGDFAEDLAAGAEAAGFPPDRIVEFRGNHDAATWLRDNTRSGDVVLLKGSRKYKLEEIVEGLRG
ncbi:MAG: UDP-N-acetylmuramoyl-tripeptide--D-alanyl-D-alanine ligase [Candidatus Eremiobacteraeota bacterium]|nr:UDP-N-acetylmuramoyl-tripeptide--D-alanyl-D-alanine ligase [Candidatus Eremiobacteraeota bacterium]